nr:protein PYRICULARIA ORYZAE RESISTANCE 21-like isoform X1 [Malus domestica]
MILPSQSVTIMVLKVDLQCHKCYKKVKKVLCKFPQIRDQIYDEKQNQVVIKVVCCSPEKIRDKICCKGGGAIKSIEIKEPEKPKPPPPVEKPPPEKPKPAPPPPEKPKPAPPPPEKPKPPPEKPKPPVEPVKPCPPPMQPVPCVPGYPPPVRTCCTDCYHGHAGGPCYSGYGGGPPPYIQYDGYYGRPVYDSYGGGSRGYCEENPSACTVM